MKIKANYLGLIFVTVFSFLTIKPLFVPGFFPMHDDTQVARVYQMGIALKDGVFPVRWVPDLGYGYGYPIFNFYAPLAYYVGGFLTLVGFNALISTKIMMGAGFVIAGIFMYLLTKEFFGVLGGILSSLLYMFAPYHAVNLYVRGAVAEYWAYAFIPIMFLSLYKIYLGHKKQFAWIILGAISYAGIILSHNLTALMVTPFISFFMLAGGYFLYKQKRLHNFQFMIYSITLGVLISSFYWLPALLEMRYTNVVSQVGGKADYNLHFVSIIQLWESLWGFGGSIEGLNDGMSFRVGKIHLILSLVVLSHLSFIAKKLRINFFVLLAAGVSLLVSAFLTLAVSKSIWDQLYVMQYIQFPWRFLTLVAFFSSFIAGAAPWLINLYIGKTYGLYIKIFVSLVIVICVYMSYGKLFYPQTIIEKETSDFTNEYAIKWIASKTSDEYMPKDFIKPQSQLDIVKEKVTVLNNKEIFITIEKNNTKELSFIVNSKTASELLIKTAPYPSWRVFVNNKKINHISTKKGISFKVPPGKDRVTIRFDQTPVQLFANTVSVFSIALLFIGIIQISFNKNRKVLKGNL